jgi:hypothetical protein
MQTIAFLKFRVRIDRILNGFKDVGCLQVRFSKCGCVGRKATR